MVSIKFASLILGLLFLLHALRNSSAYAHQGWGRNGIGRENFAPVQRELLDVIPAAASRKMGLGGRKMVVDKELRKEDEKEEVMNGETSKISGKDMEASKNSLESSQDHLNNQNNSNMMEPKRLKSASSGISKSEHEAQGLPEAADEIVDLMNKDYGGMDKPRRRPPIHNHMPND